MTDTAFAVFAFGSLGMAAVGLFVFKIASDRFDRRYGKK